MIVIAAQILSGILQPMPNFFLAKVATFCYQLML